jgi:pyruvate/2-oxoglutarate dehydrogenase complex dihydrolipoamide dehydrogenase (E3) component
MDDSILSADLFISAIGVVPNNKFIPKNLLSKAGWVKVDEHLAVKGVSSIYAIGDIVEGQAKVASIIKSHTLTVARNLAADITGVGARIPLKLPLLDGSKSTFKNVKCESAGTTLPTLAPIRGAIKKKKMVFYLNS